MDVEVEDEPKPSETDPEAAEPNCKTDGFDKPDINDVPMEENQVICYPLLFASPCFIFFIQVIKSPMKSS